MRSPLRGTLVILAVAGVLLLPWTIKNYAEVHHFVPMRVGSGLNLWLGMGEIHNPYGISPNEVAVYEQVHRVRPDLEYNSVQYDEYLREKARGVIERHPLFYAEGVAHRMLLSTVGLYESAWMYRDGESPLLYRKRTGKGILSYIVNRPLEVLEDAYEPAVFLLAMVALGLSWRGHRRDHLLLIAAILSAMIPYWILHFEARYALPTLPIYFAWIALGAEQLGERVARRVRARGILGRSFGRFRRAPGRPRPPAPARAR
jgi:hypothetical protein